MNRATSFVHKLFNTPLLIAPSFEGSLIRSAEMLLKGGGTYPPLRTESSQQGTGRQQAAEGVAIIPVHNYLSYRYDEVMDYFYGKPPTNRSGRVFRMPWPIRPSRPSFSTSTAPAARWMAFLIWLTRYLQPAAPSRFTRSSMSRDFPRPLPSPRQRTNASSPAPAPPDR